VIVLDSLFPVFILVVLGVLLKKSGFTDSAFLGKSDRLVYYIFFPVMLFWKIGGASYAGGIDWTFCLVTLLVIVLMFILSTLVIKIVPVGSFQAGSFSQSCYRFNTYIGVAIILNSLGERGVTIFGILIGLAIPLINVFAVSTLIWFSGEALSVRSRVKILLRALAANPLIIGCVAGILYSRLVGTFPVFVDNVLRLMSMVTLPMALLSIGGALSFSGVRDHLFNSLLAALLKLMILPIMGYIAYTIAGVTGLEFKVGMIFLCLPASTAIYVLSSQMNSDTELASSSIVVSTLLSFVSLTVVLLI
jgi:predicted permease